MAFSSKKCALASASLKVGGSWGRARPCHSVSPSALPVPALSRLPPWCPLTSPYAVDPLHGPGWGLTWPPGPSDLLASSSQTSAQMCAGSMPCACPAEAAPAAPATASSVTGLTDPCVRTMGTRMTVTAGASRLSVSSSVPSLPSTRARVVSTSGWGLCEHRPVLRQCLSPVITHHLHPESWSSWGPGRGPAVGEAWWGCCLSEALGQWILLGGCWQHPGGSGQRQGSLCGLPGTHVRLSCPVTLQAPGPHTLGHQCPRRGKVSVRLCAGVGACSGGWRWHILRRPRLPWLCSPHSVSVGRSVCLPTLSLCVCILSSVLLSLSAPPLVSSSLTCWQDEGGTAPAARSPQPEVCPRHSRGGGSLLPGLVVLRASGQTPPPLCGPGCDCGLQTPPPLGREPPYMYRCPRAAGGQRLAAWVAA